MANPIAFSGVTRAGTRYSSQRINRRLDDRDNVLKESLVAIEKKDVAVYPTVYTAAFDGAISAANINDGVVLTVVGVNLGTTEAEWSATIGGESFDSAASIQSDGTGAELTWDNATLNGFSGNSLVHLRISISGCIALDTFIQI